MKIIVVHDYLKFTNTPNRPNIENAYRNGYWNVFKFSETLRNFLKENKIRFTTKESSQTL